MVPGPCARSEYVFHEEHWCVVRARPRGWCEGNRGTACLRASRGARGRMAGARQWASGWRGLGRTCTTRALKICWTWRTRGWLVGSGGSGGLPGSVGLGGSVGLDSSGDASTGCVGERVNSARDSGVDAASAWRSTVDAGRVGAAGVSGVGASGARRRTSSTRRVEPTTSERALRMSSRLVSARRSMDGSGRQRTRSPSVLSTVSPLRMVRRRREGACSAAWARVASLTASAASEWAAGGGGSGARGGGADSAWSAGAVGGTGGVGSGGGGAARGVGGETSSDAVRLFLRWFRDLKRPHDSGCSSWVLGSSRRGGRWRRRCVR